MRSRLALLGLAACLTLSSAASADYAAEEPDYAYAPARTGFQLGVRLSAQVPAGSLGGGASLSDLLGPRMHLAFDVGSKVSPYFFVGGYAGFSYGGSGGDFTACGSTDVYGNTLSCSAESFDGGLSLGVTFLPDAFVDPWLGVTLGYEIEALSFGTESGLLSGLSPSALAGIDFRIRNGDRQSTFSVGPYGGVTEQKYLTGTLGGVSLDPGGAPFHSWIQVGVRFTFPS